MNAKIQEIFCLVQAYQNSNALRLYKVEISSIAGKCSISEAGLRIACKCYTYRYTCCYTWQIDDSRLDLYFVDIQY